MSDKPPVIFPPTYREYTDEEKRENLRNLMRGRFDLLPKDECEPMAYTPDEPSETDDLREALARQGKAAADEAARYVDMLRERDEALRQEREAHDATRRASYDSDIHLRKQLKAEREAHEATKQGEENLRSLYRDALKQADVARRELDRMQSNCADALAESIEARRERDALRQRCERYEAAMRDVILDADQSCVNHCEKWKDYGRHAPECWADTADELRALLSDREGKTDE